jgi:hypothetical protein
MALLLVMIAGLGLWWYIASERSTTASRQWVAYTEANTPEKLREIARNYGGTPVALSARYNDATARLDVGLVRLKVANPEDRRLGEEEVVAARDELAKLAGELKDRPEERAACLLGLAKAEEELAGVVVKKEGQAPLETVGSIDKAVEYYNQAAEAAAPESPWAAMAKERVEFLKSDPNAKVTIQQLSNANQSPFPGGGGSSPLAPTGP